MIHAKHDNHDYACLYMFTPTNTLEILKNLSFRSDNVSDITKTTANY